MFVDWEILTIKNLKYSFETLSENFMLILSPVQCRMSIWAGGLGPFSNFCEKFLGSGPIVFNQLGGVNPTGLSDFRNFPFFWTVQWEIQNQNRIKRDFRLNFIFNLMLLTQFQFKKHLTAYRRFSKINTNINNREIY